jgi:hypothetical protein
MGIFDRFKKKREVDPEQQRRAGLLERGRITEGTIIDSEAADDGSGGEIVYYFYSVHGVDFESSEFLSRERLADPLKYAPGAKVGVRFDPKNHGNSMLV